MNPLTYYRPTAGNTLKTAFRHLGTVCASSASGSAGAARGPNIESARWRAHSLRLGFDGGCTRGSSAMAGAGVMSDLVTAPGVAVAAVAAGAVGGRGTISVVVVPPSSCC